VLVTAEYFRRVQARTRARVAYQHRKENRLVGRVPDKDHELFRPALLAGLGVLLSTIASALSLYLPPNV
jgi:hypothetical protein